MNVFSAAGRKSFSAKRCSRDEALERSLIFALYSPYTRSVSSVGFSGQESKPRPVDRFISTVTIAAAIISAVRLAKVADLDLSIDKVIRTVQQSVRLARTILEEAMRD